MRLERNGKKKNISYKEYENKMETRKKWSTMTFLSVFGVLLIIFLGFAKLMSPEIDISLGDDETIQTESESDSADAYHRGVDSRLKDLQQEDEGAAQNPDAAVEEDGLVKIPKHSNEASGENIDGLPEPVATAPQETSHHQQTTPQQTTGQSEQQVPPTPTQPSVTYRVVVGMYATQAQAEVARGILQEAGLGVTPRIKQIGNGYTLQVGAFSSRDAATSLSNKLLTNNYPARVTTD